MAERSGLTGEQYRKFLVEAVKAAGQMMINNAEDAVGNIDLMTDFSIKFDFSQENNGSINFEFSKENCGGVPEMTIIRSHLPSIDVIDGLLETRHKLIHNDSDKEDEYYE